MIGYLSGKFSEKSSDLEAGTILMETGGVGYEVRLPVRTARSMIVGNQVELFIHTHVREDALELFGFVSAWEKKVFNTLTTVSGIGPRSGLAILGNIEPEDLLGAIMREDKMMLTSIAGIGKKTAERMIVELIDKAGKLLMEKGVAIEKNGAKPATKAPANNTIPPQGAVSAAGIMSEAVGALISLGYKDAQAWTLVREAVAVLDDDLSVEKIIRQSLQRMAVR